MAGLGTTFKATDHDTTQQDFELMPTGIYQLEVSSSDVKDDEGNKTLWVTYDVVEPEQYKGRRIFSYIDLEHKEAKKQEDGQREFARLCRSIGISECNDSEELHFINFTAKVEASPAGVSKAGRAYKAKNRIKRFYFPDEGEVPEPAIDDNQPVAVNDNRKAAANDNKAAPAKQAAAGAKKRPWD